MVIMIIIYAILDLANDLIKLNVSQKISENYHNNVSASYQPGNQKLGNPNSNLNLTFSSAACGNNAFTGPIHQLPSQLKGRSIFPKISSRIKINNSNSSSITNNFKNNPNTCINKLNSNTGTSSNINMMHNNI